MSIMGNMNETLGSLIQQVQPGLCRLAMNGIAIKTPNGYKVYNTKTGNCIACDGFVFDIADDMFFAIMCNSVKVGDIILWNGKPCCVTKTDSASKRVEAFRYEDSTIQTIVPEKHMILGNACFYTKIWSIMGNGLGGKKNGMNSIMKMMMMKSLLGNGNGNVFGNSSSGSMNMGNIMALSMLSGNNSFGDMLNFDGLFDGSMFDDSDEAESDSAEEADG